LAKEKADLTAARDAEAKAKQDATAQRDALAAEKQQLALARDEQSKLVTQRQDALALVQQEAAGLQQRIAQLEAVNADNAYRQQLQQEELTKAETQIELIKDLLLREPGL